MYEMEFNKDKQDRHDNSHPVHPVHPCETSSERIELTPLGLVCVLLDEGRDVIASPVPRLQRLRRGLHDLYRLLSLRPGAGGDGDAGPALCAVCPACDHAIPESGVYRQEHPADDLLPIAVRTVYQVCPSCGLMTRHYERQRAGEWVALTLREQVMDQREMERVREAICRR